MQKIVINAPLTRLSDLRFLGKFVLFEPLAASLQIFRERNRNQAKFGSPFFWLLFFGEAKKSNRNNAWWLLSTDTG
ncbi:hypothetical protein [Mannheimia indoligenes]|uniref:hypothetical protein n=1 Tax=Mannheimia indoligenes TaxID=3103145 RepID=UPI002FE56815